MTICIYAIYTRVCRSAIHSNTLLSKHTLPKGAATCFLSGHARTARSSVSRTSFGRCKATQSNTDLITTLKERGLFDNCTDESSFVEALQKPLKVYCGFDPTADSLHLGNLLGIVVLSWFQRKGHHPVILVGGATGRVGDPSGRSHERPLLDEQTLSRNVAAISSSIESILMRDKNNSNIIVLNNYDWFKEITFLEFLRDVGKHARLGSMLSKDSVRSRLESDAGLSFTEFSYQLLQGYDFMHLYKNENVCVQIGGSDQWGNITAGTELIRRVLREDEAYGFTFPLLLKSDGTKFGKSATGAIWLSRDKLSPYHFYQYLLNTTDSDVIRLLRMLTFLSLERISVIEQSMSETTYVPNTAQRILAEEVTRFVHGDDGLNEALKATESLRPGTETVLNVEALQAVADVVPSIVIGRNVVVGTLVTDVLAASGLVESKGAAKRMVRNGGVRINNVKIVEEIQTIKESDVIGGNMILLAAGKKNKILLRLEE